MAADTVHVLVTGVKSRSHLLYVASYLRTRLAQSTQTRLLVSVLPTAAFLAADTVGIDDVRELLPADARITVTDDFPGWRFQDGAEAVYVSVGAPGMRALSNIRRADPRRRVHVVVTDEGIGTYGSFATRRDAMRRQGVSALAASLKAGIVVTSARLFTSERWAAYVRSAGAWSVSDPVAGEFARHLPADVRPGRTDLAVVLTQPFVDLGLVDEDSYLAYVEALCAAAREAGLRPVVRAHPAERRERYDHLDVLAGRGTAELDPAVVTASVVMGGPSTALVNLAAMEGVRVLWVSEPSLTALDTDVSKHQREIFDTFLGPRIPLAALSEYLR